MDFMSIIDGAMGLAKEAVDVALSAFDVAIEKWNNLEDDRKKMLIGCIAVTVAVIAVASIAYSIGKAHGQNQFLDEDDDF